VLLIAGFVTIYYSKSNRGLIAGALLLALSYFTKQTALVFVPAIVFYLWRIRSWKPALLFSAAFAVFLLGGIIILDRIYDGWFTYYTLLVPKGKGKTLRWGYALDGFFVYVLLRCWFITTIISVLQIKPFLKKKTTEDNAAHFFGLFFGISLIAGFLGILNMGGGHNVFLPLAAACAFLLPLAAVQFSQRTRFGQFLSWLIPIQLLFLIAIPWKDPRNIVREADKPNQEKFFADVASMQGEVWIAYHGFTEQSTGKKEYADINALQDVLLVNDSSSHVLAHQLDTALLFKHWDYILSDIRDTFPHYTLSTSAQNLNKIQSNDSALLYIYKPE
jgi:hypothetical protein